MTPTRFSKKDAAWVSSRLTLREIELCQLLANSSGYREAATAMRMKEQTIRIWTIRIRRKLASRTTEHMIANMVRCGLVK